MCISTAHRCPVGACAPTGMHLASCSLLGVAAAVFVAPAAAGRVVSCSPQIDSCTAVDLGRARIELPSRAVTPRRPRRRVRGAPGTGESLVRTHYCAGSPMGCGAECSLTVCAWYMYAQRVVCTARNECRLHLQVEWWVVGSVYGRCNCVSGMGGAGRSPAHCRTPAGAFNYNNN